MNKRTIFTALLALVALTAFGQTKTATIKGYSPALKGGTVAIGFIDNTYAASDTVMDGRFKLILPVEKLTECSVLFLGEGCPTFRKSIFITPDAVVSMTGEDCLYPTWTVESTLPEQTTANRIAEHTRGALAEYLRLELSEAPYEQQDSAYMEIVRLTMDILPSLPVDAASLSELASVSTFARNEDNFPYKEQLKALEKDHANRAPKGFESDLAYIHSLVYPLHILQPGEEAIDADFFDMEGNSHHLSELRGRYVLLDFWSLGCAPCRMAEPEMKQAYESLNGRLEIVGINLDSPLAWRGSEWSKKLVWQNWSEGKMRKGGIESRYCDKAAMPYYVLLSPDQRIVWKASGYTPGMFSEMPTLVAMTGQSQEVKMNEPSFDDYLPLLENKGYAAYGFDISMFEGKKAKLVIKEYIDGQEIRDCLSTLPYPVTFTIKDKISIGFMPIEEDSLGTCVINVNGGGRLSTRLKLKSIRWGEKTVCSYGTRPFELVPPFKVGDFIPLALYGSYWYDANFGITRFCGENFIKPDLTSEYLLKDCPHYFVVGIKVEE